MAKETASAACCEGGTNTGAMRVESLVSIDERGQMVLPKDLRERMGVGAGDKLALVSWEKDGEVCCVSLIKTEVFGNMVKDFLGPMMSEMAST